jgi:hypothetical protein
MQANYLVTETIPERKAYIYALLETQDNPIPRERIKNKQR